MYHPCSKYVRLIKKSIIHSYFVFGFRLRRSDCTIDSGGIYSYKDYIVFHM